MKKFLIVIFSLLSGFVFASCGGNDPVTDATDFPETETPDTPGDDPDNSGTQTDKILIVYFSRTGYNYPNQWLDIGHTARVARYIADLTGGDRFEILPVVPYPDNYQETVAIAREEYDNDARPAIQNKIENLDDYDTVFIGNPIWHGAAPMIIRTFYESYDLTGIVLVPFSTHAGSGLGDSERLARNYYPDNTVLSGLAVQGTDSFNAHDDVEAWLERIGIIE